MVWNKTLPADSSKLRISAGLIRQNWDALETGGVPYDYLQLSEQAANPTRAGDTGWLFTKAVASQTELFYEDDRNPASVIQLTNNGGIGNSAVSLYANNITFNNGSTFLDKNKQVLGWLRVNSNGSVAGTSGDMTVARNSSGVYTVTFNTVTISSYAAIVQISSSGVRRSSSVTNRVAASFRVTIYSNSTGDPEDEDFMVVVFGGR